jgi:hypothetical protein
LRVEAGNQFSFQKSSPQWGETSAKKEMKIHQKPI